MIIEENGHHAGKVYMVVVEDETYNKHWQFLLIDNFE